MSCFVLFLGFFESRAWQIFLITLVIFSAWICPFELAFLRQLPKNLYIADNIVNTFFAVDIVLTFFVAYLDKETYLLVDNPKRIAARYVPITYFVWGILSAPTLCSQSNSNLAPNVQKLYPSLLKTKHLA
jgi:Ion transport protein